ncbi:hypothetical protein Tco_0319649 [Tanacetum coccineum]
MTKLVSVSDSWSYTWSDGVQIPKEQFGQPAFIKRGRWNIRNYGSPRFNWVPYCSRFRINNLRGTSVVVAVIRSSTSGRFFLVEDYIGLLETMVDEDVFFWFGVSEDMTAQWNLTLLSLFFGSQPTNLSIDIVDDQGSITPLYFCSTLAVLSLMEDLFPTILPNCDLALIASFFWIKIFLSSVDDSFKPLILLLHL